MSHPPSHRESGQPAPTVYHAAAAHLLETTYAQQAMDAQFAATAGQRAYVRHAEASRSVAMQRAISAQHNVSGRHSAPAAHHGGTAAGPGGPSRSPAPPELPDFPQHQQSIYPTSPPWARPAPIVPVPAPAVAPDAAPAVAPVAATPADAVAPAGRSAWRTAIIKAILGR